MRPNSGKSGADEGGDVLTDLLHLQKHRRGRSLAKLTAAMREGALGHATVRAAAETVVLPTLAQGPKCLDSSHKESLRVSKKSKQIALSQMQYDHT